VTFRDYSSTCHERSLPHPSQCILPHLNMTLNNVIGNKCSCYIIFVFCSSCHSSQIRAWPSVQGLIKNFGQWLELLNTWLPVSSLIPFKVLLFVTHSCSSAPATVGKASRSLLLESPADSGKCCGDVTHRTFWSSFVLYRIIQKEVYNLKNLFYKYYWTYGDVLYIDWRENSQSYFDTLQALDVSPTCDAADVKSIIQLFPHST
jgi:hypothetical protein